MHYFTGLNALAQAMICNVGWLSGEKSEEERKKIIILMSDGEMHYALDGLLGGITNKFDIKRCSSEISEFGFHWVQKVQKLQVTSNFDQ